MHQQHRYGRGRYSRNACGLPHGLGAQLIQLDEAEIVLTGGIESMSQAPHEKRGLRSGLKLGQGKLEVYLYEALLDPSCGRFMAQTAEKCAGKYGVSTRSGFAERVTFIIGADGKIARVFPEVRVSGHSDEVLFALREVGKAK